MTTEMDVMRMDERQRDSWLRANRLTLIVVGVVWLGMIGWELAHGSAPWFLIVMLPIFAALRALAYLHYQHVD